MILGRWRLASSDLFTLFVIAIMATALIMAWDWTLRASVLILVLGFAGLALATAQLLLDIVSRERGRVAAAPQFEIPSFDEADASLVSKSSLAIWLWLVGLVCAIPLVGMPIALTIFVAVYARIYGASWAMALLAAAMVALFIWGVYIQLMHVYWPVSLLGRYIDGI